MKPLTESEIRSSLVNLTPAEVQRMPLPGLHEVIWEEREYLGWRDPGAAQRGYLVFWRDGVPVGLTLRASAAGRLTGTAMCSLCSTQQPAGQVTMFTAARAGEAGRAGNSVGIYICADLACSLLIRIAPPTHDWQPDPAVTIAAKAARLELRLHAFTARVLDPAA